MLAIIKTDYSKQTNTPESSKPKHPNKVNQITEAMQTNKNTKNTKNNQQNINTHRGNKTTLYSTRKLEST